MERVFRYLASLLYFFDRVDKLLALESSAAGRRTGGKGAGVQNKTGKRRAKKEEGETQIIKSQITGFYYSVRAAT